MIERFYRGRRVLVTGHTGFKGGWLTLWLESLGAKVTGLALKPQTKPSLFGLAKIADRCDSHFQDIRDLKGLTKLVAKAKPEIVFHMAAQPLVRRSYARPAETFEVNAQGTVNVLEAARLAGTARSIVVVTTDKCYENPDGKPRKETDPLGGRDPYSASKAAAELAAAAYRSSFFQPSKGVGLATARAGNVIGGGDWSEDRLIPDCLRALGGGAPVKLRNPRSVRPWQHVLEPLSGYLLLGKLLAEKPADFAEAWNFGPADAPPDVETVARTFMERCAGKAKLVIRPAEDGLYESPALRLDVSKAAKRLRWRPRWDAARAVEETARWHKAHLAGKFDAAAFCLEQIESYV